MHLLSNKKILITGGLGFIGSFLIKKLLLQNNTIVVLDSCNPATSSANEMGLLDSITTVQGSILDDSVLDALDDDFDYIVHAAGILGIKTVVEKPVLTADVNVFGTRKILDLAKRQKNLQRFILFSTSEVYGQFCSNISEDSPSVISNIGMRWVYASSKQFSEYLLKAYIQEYGIPGVIVRPFNVYGPFRQGSNAMTTLVRQALQGDTIKLSGDGKQSRAWCYIDDFVDGLIGCLVTDGIIGEAFNLGNNQESLSMLSLAERICSIVDSDSEIVIAGGSVEDVLERAPDISKAARMLGYTPKHSLNEGIKEVAEWMSSVSVR